MALTTELRIFPDKELFAVDMAEIVNASVPLSGVIQGCNITLDDSTGTLAVDTGRILINGRLGVISEGGTLVAPIVEGSSNVRCHVVAVCNLSSSVTPFTVEIVNQATYEEYQQRRESTRDVFNTQDGFSYHYLGSVMVNPTSGKIETWTPSAEADAKKRIDINYTNSGGTYLPDGTNIDTIDSAYSGWWAYDRTKVNGTFPIADNYGTFGHIQGSDSNSAMQFIRSNSQANNDRILYVRYKLNGVWGNIGWQRLVSANPVTLTISRVNNNYCTQSDIAGMAAVKKSGFLWLRGELFVSTSLPDNNVVYRIANISGWNALNTVSLYLSNPNSATIMVTVTSTGEMSISNRTPVYYGESTSTYGYYPFVLCVPCRDGQE